MPELRANVVNHQRASLRTSNRSRKFRVAERLERSFVIQNHTVAEQLVLVVEEGGKDALTVVEVIYRRRQMRGVIVFSPVVVHADEIVYLIEDYIERAYLFDLLPLGADWRPV